jgi:hypothetical protein
MDKLLKLKGELILYKISYCLTKKRELGYFGT